jgi:hypothetical protein
MSQVTRVCVAVVLRPEGEQIALTRYRQRKRQVPSQEIDLYSCITQEEEEESSYSPSTFPVYL